MREDTTRQSVLFPDLFKKPLVVKFDQPHSSSDGGAILLKACDERLGLSERLAKGPRTNNLTVFSAVCDFAA